MRRTLELGETGAEAWWTRLEGGKARPINSYPASSIADLGTEAVRWAVGVGQEIATRAAAEGPLGPAAFAAGEELPAVVEALTVQAMVAVVTDSPPDRLAPQLEIALEDWVTRGFSASRVMAGFRRIHAALSEELLAAVKRHSLTSTAALTEMQRVSARLHEHMNGLAGDLVQAHQVAAERWHSSAAAIQAELVASLLAGAPVDLDAASRRLCYPLVREHLALVVMRRPDGRVRGSLGDLVRHWLHAADAGASLIVPNGAAIWVWLAPRGSASSLRERLVESRPTGVLAASGTPASGVAGFRLAHREAQAAARLLDPGEPGLLSYHEVELVHLLGRDREQAEAFVRRELGELAHPARADLRDTLRTYFAEGRSISRSAARLHVARNTVTYRVNLAAQLLGRDVGERRLELECALRLMHRSAAKWGGAPR